MPKQEEGTPQACGEEREANRLKHIRFFFYRIDTEEVSMKWRTEQMLSS